MEKRHFTAFYRTHAAKVYKFVFFRVAGNKELAQDLTQEIFLKAFEAFERYDPARSQSSWIYTIARNHLINHHAKTRPGVDLEEIEGTIWASVDMRERMASRYDERRLLDAMRELESEDAKLIRMKYLEGWQFDELAELFDKSSGALRVQAGRVMKRIKELMNADMNKTV